MTTSPVTTLTDELISELEAAARESIYGCPTWLERDGYALGSVDGSDRNFIATSSPSIILELLAERAELKKDAERLQKIADGMTMSFGREDYGLWLFPAWSVASDRASCTLDDLRSFIDTEYRELPQ